MPRLHRHHEGEFLASERSVSARLTAADRSEHGEYSADERKRCFEMPIRNQRAGQRASSQAQSIRWTDRRMQRVPM